MRIMQQLEIRWEPPEGLLSVGIPITILGGSKVQCLPVPPINEGQTSGPGKRKQRAQCRGRKPNRKPRPVNIDWDELTRRLQKHEQDLPESEKTAREVRAREEAKRYPCAKPSAAVEALKKLYLGRPLE